MMTRRELIRIALAAVAAPLAAGCGGPQSSPATDLNRPIVAPAGVAGEKAATQKVASPKS
jgi:hypothetical protein